MCLLEKLFLSCSRRSLKLCLWIKQKVETKMKCSLHFPVIQVQPVTKLRERFAPGCPAPTLYLEMSSSRLFHCSCWCPYVDIKQQFEDNPSLTQQRAPEGQPIYEEIPHGQCQPVSSDHSSDYVDTTSGYHTLPLDNDYSESETGLFLVPMTSHNKPLIMTKDFQVPSGKTNKKFFTFHRKTLESEKTLKSSDHDIVNSNFLNQFESLNKTSKQPQPKKTKCGKTLIHSKTLQMNHQNNYNYQQNLNTRPRTGYSRATYQPLNTLNTRLTRPSQAQGTLPSRTIGHSAPIQNSAIQRHNQDNFLPRTAWTDTSGSDDWMDVANDNKSDIKARNQTTSKQTNNSSDFYERPVCPSPPDLISNKCRTSPTSPSVISTSDVTVSPSSSESYPECRF